METGRGRRFSAVLPAAFALAVAVAAWPAGPAGAAPADRGGDAVVMKGSKLPRLAGAVPDRIVGFAWRGRRWVQVPVQVDQRHTVDVRSLYPAGTYPPYVGDDSPAFSAEIYADPKTRSGADGNPAFDSDDELVFMGRDTGGTAPKKARSPQGVVKSSGTRITVRDGVGGGAARIYLFRAARPVDQSAGRDYVKYDFNPLNIGSGQTLRDDYGYFHSANPEDSTVITPAYILHSVDRWMEDGMRVTAGRASGVNILDREVAQATRFICARSEYTFSGRWTEDTWPNNDGDTDDEGTYVAAIDGPVRAIRSYMGANSGPYTQREHIYYGDHEQNTVFLRVHPMTDLYAWTDYSKRAIGMTYRDSKNPGGVPVDGAPDTLVPTKTADVANGAYAWQQLSGPQGTVSTVVGADTDIAGAKLGNYYLDESAPDGPDEVQCGGDGKSIGASGVAILQGTPNTDPRLGPFNNLVVKRTRYFDGPGGGTTLARRYTQRVTQPLTGTASPMP